MLCTLFGIQFLPLWSCVACGAAGRERQQAYSKLTLTLQLMILCIFIFTSLTAAVNDGRRPRRGCLYLPTCSKYGFYAERPIFPLGHGLVCRTLMLLICYLQTLCFLFSTTSLSCPPLTILVPLFLLAVFPLSPVFFLQTCLFFLSFFFVLSSPLSLLPFILMLPWESGRNTFSHTAKTH